MKTFRNFVQLIGNIGQDVEFREFEKGMKKASFSLATNDYYSNGKGEKTEKTEWHNIVAWGNLASNMNDVLHKGDKILLQGSLTHRKYEDGTGVVRYLTEVLANDFMRMNKG